MCPAWGQNVRLLARKGDVLLKELPRSIQLTECDSSVTNEMFK